MYVLCMWHINRNQEIVQYSNFIKYEKQQYIAKILIKSRIYVMQFNY